MAKILKLTPEDYKLAVRGLDVLRFKIVESFYNEMKQCVGEAKIHTHPMNSPAWSGSVIRGGFMHELDTLNILIDKIQEVHSEMYKTI